MSEEMILASGGDDGNGGDDGDDMVDIEGLMIRRI
jgi:hypothetical protein